MNVPDFSSSTSSNRFIIVKLIFIDIDNSCSSKISLIYFCFLSTSRTDRLQNTVSISHQHGVTRHSFFFRLLSSLEREWKNLLINRFWPHQKTHLHLKIIFYSHFDPAWFFIKQQCLVDLNDNGKITTLHIPFPNITALLN